MFMAVFAIKIQYDIVFLLALLKWRHCLCDDPKYCIHFDMSCVNQLHYTASSLSCKDLIGLLLLLLAGSGS